MYETFLSIPGHTISIFVPLQKVPISKTELPGYLDRLYKAKAEAFERAMVDNTDYKWKCYKDASDLFDKKLAKFNRSV